MEFYVENIVLSIEKIKNPLKSLGDVSFLKYFENLIDNSNLTNRFKGILNPSGSSDEDRINFFDKDKTISDESKIILNCILSMAILEKLNNKNLENIEDFAKNILFKMPEISSHII